MPSRVAHNILAEHFNTRKGGRKEGVRVRVRSNTTSSIVESTLSTRYLYFRLDVFPPCEVCCLFLQIVVLKFFVGHSVEKLPGNIAVKVLSFFVSCVTLPLIGSNTPPPPHLLRQRAFRCGEEHPWSYFLPSPTTCERHPNRLPSHHPSIFQAETVPCD